VRARMHGFRLAREAHHKGYRKYENRSWSPQASCDRRHTIAGAIDPRCEKPASSAIRGVGEIDDQIYARSALDRVPSEVVTRDFCVSDPNLQVEGTSIQLPRIQICRTASQYGRATRSLPQRRFNVLRAFAFSGFGGAAFSPSPFSGPSAGWPSASWLRPGARAGAGRCAWTFVIMRACSAYSS